MIVRVRPASRSAINPPRNRREIDEARIEAEDRRRERLRRERAIKSLDGRAKGPEPGDIFYVARQEQLLRHVEDEQGLHAVIGETLPALRECKIAEALGMAEESRIAAIGRCERDLGIGIRDGHSSSSPDICAER
jgi:hypothetical protein